MNVVGMLDDSQRDKQPAYVRFERVPVEDVAASAREGRYVARDVDFALVTPMYSRDVFKAKVSTWLPELKRQAHEGKIPQEWLAHYEAAYAAFQKGQTLPLVGTPIKGWGVISPAQQEVLIRMMVLTVEDLAAINEEGMRSIGMGAVALRDKAKAWLSQLRDKGPLTQEVATLKASNASLTATVELLTQRVQTLLNQVETQPKREAPEMGPLDLSGDPTPPDDVVVPITKASKKRT